MAKGGKEELQGLSKQELLAVVEKMRQQYALSITEVQKLIPKSNAKEVFISTAIFTHALGSLESIVCYLKEQIHLSYHEIAVLLRRDDRTIWATYAHAKKKVRKERKVKKEGYQIPISILQDRKWGVLEHIVKHLKEEEGLSYKEIAEQVQRDERTVWTAYARARRKAQ